MKRPNVSLAVGTDLESAETGTVDSKLRSDFKRLTARATGSSVGVEEQAFIQWFARCNEEIIKTPLYDENGRQMPVYAIKNAARVEDRVMEEDAAADGTPVESAKFLTSVSPDYLLIKNRPIVQALANAFNDMGVGDGATFLIRQYEDAVFMDIAIDHPLCSCDVLGESVTAGLSVSWSHDASRTVRARPFVRFDDGGGMIRTLHDENGEKLEYKLYHRGKLSVEDVKEKLYMGFTEMLYAVGTLRKQVIEPILESKDTRVDPNAFDFSGYDTEHSLVLTELYEGLGLPSRLAEAATVYAADHAGHLSSVTHAKVSDGTTRGKLLNRVSDTKTYRVVDVVKGIVNAVKYVSNAAVNGGTNEEYQRTAFRVLDNPDAVLARAFESRVDELDELTAPTTASAAGVAAEIDSL